MKKLRILVVSNTYLPTKGGTELVVSDFSRELVRRGHDVTVLTTTLYAPEAFVGSEVIDGVKVIRCKNDSFAIGFGFSYEFTRKLAKIWGGFDLVHIHGYSRFASEYALYYLRGKLPIVFTGHGFTHTNPNHPLKLLHNKTIGRIVSFADACTALTPLERPIYHRLGVPDEKIYDIPNGVDTKRFSREVPAAKINAMRKSWGVMPGEKVVLFVGRVHPSKGLGFLVKAVSNLPKVRLVIVGPDSGYGKTILEESKKLGMLKRVVLAGKIPDASLPVAYHCADMLSLPSQMEGFGLVLVEAMAAGLPLVTSNRGAMPYLVKEGVNGFTVNYGDVLALKEKIEYLVKTPSKAKIMGEAGRRMANAYSLPKVVSKLEAVYEKVLQAKGR